jgi:peptide chain release factor 1
VHTSTVTVAVLSPPSATEFVIDERDIEWQACRGSGAGGQHRNMTDSAVQIFHRPSGLMVRCETERSQHQNRATAMSLLRARLQQHERDRVDTARGNDRRQQIGSGMRGDKRRTIRVQDGVVTDHVLDVKWQLKSYLRGEW